MVQAAARSGFDFSAAKLRSRTWWLKLKWTLDRLEEEHFLDIHQLQHAAHAALLGCGLTDEAFKQHIDGLNDKAQKVYKIQFPWVKETTKDGKHSELMEQWKQRYGDPRDPKTQKIFKAIADSIYRKIESNKKKNPFDHVKKFDQALRKKSERSKHKKWTHNN